jgi:hypothetical protein
MLDALVCEDRRPRMYRGGGNISVRAGSLLFRAELEAAAVGAERLAARARPSVH